MPAGRIWIIDGHNMIFAIPPLRELQVSHRGEEARSGLTDRLERFALARSEKVLVVFDGSDLPSSPDASRRSLLETVYARGGAGAADRRIIDEAGRCLERGLVVAVVTNDVHTLVANLPRGVQHLEVEAFWLKHIDKSAGEGDRRSGGGRRAEGDKRIEGDFSDVEREMLTRAAMTEPAFGVREPGPPPARAGHRPGGGAGVPSSPGASARTARAAGERESMRDQIVRKREKGRLRQERRLKRRAKDGS
jgi:predicted RNA-binding protein with PIN domain